MSTPFIRDLGRAAEIIETYLMNILTPYPDEPVVHAMRYAVRGGKRLRGFLVLESAALFDIPVERALPAAAAIEALHAYSLIHDDLPSMDDDDLRRGQPTVHVKWDEATAILAGDALQTLAFELLTDPVLGSADVRLTLLRNLAIASGAQKGMVLGQARDIAAETATCALSLEAITALQAGKTGALIEWSAQAGAILAGHSPQALGRYAQAIGLAFQITDDILDVTGDCDLAGKRLRKDAQAHKATFVSILGLDGATARAHDLIATAQSHLLPYGNKAQRLIETAHFVISRQN